MSERRLDAGQVGPAGAGARAEIGEGCLEFGGESRILGADSPLHLLEADVGIERAGLGIIQLARRRERHARVDPAPHLREDQRCHLRVLARGTSGAHRGEPAQLRPRRFTTDAEVGENAGVRACRRGLEIGERIGNGALRFRQAKQRGVHRHGPAIVSGERGLEGRHRRTGDADGHAAIEVEW
jgi:hypothetical protein